MKKYILIILVAGFFSCDKDDMEDGNLTMNLIGLTDLGPNYAYEGWIIVNGNPVSTGVFTVNNTGQLSRSSFAINAGQLQSATKFVLTIEPKPDADPAPSGVKILAGDFSGSSATVTVGHMDAIGNNFSLASGSYILATPTDGMGTNEKSGIWFLDPAVGPGPSLTLPALPAAWKYEGWAVINGIPVTTGKFSMPSGMDESSPFSGALPGPPFPGEDYLMNAPAGLTFPTNLAGNMVVITIEPHPDNSNAPFGLKPLSATIPAGAADHTTYQLMNVSATGLASGMVSR